MPWGAVRVAFRRSSVQKANLWFTTLFGGGCLFPSGEDSLWLLDAKRKGLTFYVSKETIGKVDMEESTWFSGYDEKFFFGKGACCAAMYGRWSGLWSCYYLLRYCRAGKLSIGKKFEWMQLGRQAYARMCPFDQIQKFKQL